MKKQIKRCPNRINMPIFVVLSIVFSVIIIVSFVVVVFTSDTIYEDSFTQQAISYNLNYAAQIAKTLSGTFSKLDYDFRVLSKSDRIQQIATDTAYNDEHENYINQLYIDLKSKDEITYSSICSLNLYLKNGIQYSSGSYPFTMENIFDSKYFTKAFDLPASLRWLGYNEDTGQYECVKMVYDSTYHITGLIVACFKSYFIKNMIAGSSLAGLADFCIMDCSGSIIYENTKRTADWCYSSAWIDHMTASEGHFWLDGRLILYKDLANESSTTFAMPEWYLVFLNTDRGVVEIITKVRNAVIVFCVLICLSAIAIIALVSNRITKSIVRLREYMETVVKQGNFRIQMPEISCSCKEINQFVMSFDYMIHMNRELIDKSIQQEIKQREIEERILSSQITPHFIYNALQIVNLQAYESGNREICEMVKSLSHILTDSIRSNEKTVTVKDELAYVSSYMTIIQYRYGGEIKLILDCDHAADAFQIPKFMIQIFVENAVQHGFVPKGGKGSVYITIRDTGDAVEFEIIDDGSGMDIETLASLKAETKRDIMEYVDNQEHIGINNIIYRLKMMYKETFGFHITSIINAGTKVYISLPKAGCSQNARGDTDNV